MYKILIRCVLDLKMEKGPLAQERYLFIYRKICLGFSSQMGLVPCLMGLARGSRSTPNNKPPKVRWERRSRSLRTLWIGFIRQWTRHVPMSQMIVMNGTSWLGFHKWSVMDGPSWASCHRHTSDSDQTSYSGMVARTICEDSVLNHRSKLPWMKRQSTNCQEQVAIDIIMNVPPWTNRHNQITTVDMSLRYCCDPCVDGVVPWWSLELWLVGDA